MDEELKKQVWGQAEEPDAEYAVQRLTCKETTVLGTAYDFFPLELWKQLQGEPAPADRQRVLQIGGRDALGVLPGTRHRAP